MAKAPDAFRTISEVSESLDTPAHVLRFWESKFSQVKPVKRAGGRRYYRPEDLALLAGIKVLLHEHGMTIKGAQKVLREQGVKAVAALAPDAQADASGVIDSVAAATRTSAVPVESAADPVESTPASVETAAAPSEAALPPAMDDSPAEDSTPETDSESTDQPAAADPVPDNVVTMPTPPRGTPAPAPTPRPVPPPRILAVLGRCDPALVARNAAEIAPLRDRLAALHARMTKH